MNPSTIRLGSNPVVIPVPSESYNFAEELSNAFDKSMESHEKERSPAELVLRFITFVSRQKETISTSSYPGTGQFLEELCNFYERSILETFDIHTHAGNVTNTSQFRPELLHLHYTTYLNPQIPLKLKMTSLFRAASTGNANIYAIFGGQGNTREYWQEIQQLYHAYEPLFKTLVVALDSHLSALACHPAARKQFPQGLSVLDWLRNTRDLPSSEYLLRAPVSLPLIGLLQCMSLHALIAALGISPQEIPLVFKKIHGHSQGIVVAAVASSSSSWEDWYQYSIHAITILFWIGVRSQQAFADALPSPNQISAIAERGQGEPSPMLSVSNTQQHILIRQINRLNDALPISKHVAISLVNSDTGFVVSGPRRALIALSDIIQKDIPKESQHRVPFSKRRAVPSLTFLPVSLPFHSNILSSAVDAALEDLKDVRILRCRLRIPVNQTAGGFPWEDGSETNIVPDLVRLVTVLPVNWKDQSFDGATHVVDFGPGLGSGIGALAQRSLQGTGTRSISANVLAKSQSSSLGSRLELFDRQNVFQGKDWSSSFGPEVIQTTAGMHIATRFSRLLGLPPFMIAGMTPTTAHIPLVAKAMQAGYHIELAGGAYHSPARLTEALEKLRPQMPKGRAVALNIIYINPRAIAWQIPLIQKLVAEGYPIDSITVGGGVPSLDVATQYITTLGLRYISFKPGSIAAIQSVLQIARANPLFPVVLQWTGGRGGGHHSFEDFHQPILDTYDEIRHCSNVILVAGSGFGCVDDVHPYLTGIWSQSRGKAAAMPFDGILFGSRVMTCLEANTATGSKSCIANSEGLKDNQWEGTIKGSCGGIISIKSEMGEAMHVVATRGAIFWAEMDSTIFGLSKDKQLPVLRARRNEIIQRLNKDFQKVWFGHNAKTNSASDIRHMTYAEVLHRMASLMFLPVPRGWIDESYHTIFLDFFLRTKERHALPIIPESAILALTRSDPVKAIQNLACTHPAIYDNLLSTEDIHYFLQICRRANQKPVPFVPVLDISFENWFKKDSLWQSEDLAAVQDRDAQRTLILQGPVAVRSISKIDEPVKDVMDAINDGNLSLLLDNGKYGDPVKLKYEEFLAPFSVISDAEKCQSKLRAKEPSWKTAFLTHPVFFQDRGFVANPLSNILTPTHASIHKGEDVVAFGQYSENGEFREHVTVERNGQQIAMRLWTDVSISDEPIPLSLLYEYHPEASYCPIWETTEDRAERIYTFYENIWLGKSLNGPKPPVNFMRPYEKSAIVEKTAVQAFIEATNYTGACDVPLDFGIVLAWGAISRALLQRPVQGDLLTLVHLSNKFKVQTVEDLFQIGDCVTASAQIQKIGLGNSGKLIEISCNLKRHETVIVTITSEFLIRGSCNNSDNCYLFSKSKRDLTQVAFSSSEEQSILFSKPWIRWDYPTSHSLDKADLLFQVETICQEQVQSTRGGVYVTLQGQRRRRVGTVDYAGEVSVANPVLEMLDRRGQPFHRHHPLENAIPLPCEEFLVLSSSNIEYSHASGDFNPIHTSPVFSNYVQLPGTISHGMKTSAQVRYAVTKWAAEGDERRISLYNVYFVGMVLPGDTLRISLQHVAMKNGLKVVQIDVSKQDSGEKVLSGEAHIHQPPTAFFFAGQGSQQVSMGMDLYERSSIARNLWDRCDAYFENQFGFQLRKIVCENPTELVIRFGGPRGRQLRQNYMQMVYEIPEDGTIHLRRMFPEVSAETAAYRFRYPGGLLFATQFAQPALTVMEMASYQDAASRQVVPQKAVFAGHSLGEYAALAAVTDFVALEKLLYVVFCRGLTMQAAVERDDLNRSSYGMVAVDPYRVSSAFNDSGLQTAVTLVSRHAGFVEIVNFNVFSRQYICAGDLRALDCLQHVLDALSIKYTSDLDALETLIRQQSIDYKEVQASTLQLRRGRATVPLAGIDVPFHSSQLKPMIEPFRRILSTILDIRGAINPTQLVGRYVPNLTGTPFSLDPSYIKAILARTGSTHLRHILDHWESEWGSRIRRERALFSGIGQ
ncbi:unnamed protein product [Penicillium pancosmium]